MHKHFIFIDGCLTSISLVLGLGLLHIAIKILFRQVTAKAALDKAPISLRFIPHSLASERLADQILITLAFVARNLFSKTPLDLGLLAMVLATARTARTLTGQKRPNQAFFVFIFIALLAFATLLPPLPEPHSRDW